MSEETQGARSVAGDPVNMSVEIFHEMNLQAVGLIFGHETNERVEIALSDDGPARPEPISRGSMERRSKWELSGRIGPEHIPGVYTLTRINLFTSGERLIKLDPNGSLAHRPLPRIRVVEEPESVPYFGTIEFVYDR